MYGGIFKKRLRDDDALSSESKNGATSGAASGARTSLQTIYHYPSDLPFPVMIHDSFPAETYRSRSRDVKAAVHWGQRKLLLSEIQLLSMYARPDTAYHIVYAGSAPGTHLAFLDELFRQRHTWELIDPGRFDRAVLEHRTNFTLRNEFFTNATAYDINARRLSEVCPAIGAIYRERAVTRVGETKKTIHEELQSMVGTLDVARGTEAIPSMYEPPLDLPVAFNLLCSLAMERSKPLLFVSDIRSGSVNLSNFEDHVAENMRAQECWTQILEGEHSMLKFRLPYTHKNIGFGDKRQKAMSKLIESDGTVRYLRGDIVLPIWTRPTSTEGRLVVPRGAHQISYNVAHMENQFFFFNTRVREQIHFNHILLPDVDLDHHYDAAAEVNCLLTYLQFISSHLKIASIAVLRREVKRVSAAITKHLRISFSDAIRRREALVLKQAVNGHLEEEEGDDSDCEGEDYRKNSSNDQQGTNKEGESWEKLAKGMLTAASRERSRIVWKRNVDESVENTSSGFWVTTSMKQ